MEPISYNETRLREFSTEHLNMMLQLDCAGILPLELDTILVITAILTERRETDNPRSVPNAEESFQSFKERFGMESSPEAPEDHTIQSVLPSRDTDNKSNMPSQITKKLSPLKWIAAILVLVMFVGYIPSAFGASNVFERIAQWTDEVFTFLNPTPSVILNHSPSNNLDALIEIVQQGKYIPMWLPEELSMQVVRYQGDKSTASVYVYYTYGEKDLGIVFRLLADNNTRYMKDETEVEIYTAGNQQHYIMSNNDQLTCAWVTDTLECTVYGDLTREEMYRIIDSIYSKP